MAGREVAILPKRRAYYGWVIVAVSCATQTLALGAGTITFGILLRPISDEMGWSRAVVTGAGTLQTVTNVVLAPFIGSLIDRFGPRRLMPVGAALAMLAFQFLGGVAAPWQFYLLYALLAAPGLNDAVTFATTATVSKWFIRRRGRALALASMGIDFGTILIAPLSAWLASTLGWRTTFSILGLVLGCITIPMTALFMRRSPEDLGLRPDGDQPTEPEPPAAATPAAPSPPASAPQEVAWSPREAARTRPFWLLLVAINFGAAGASAIMYHLVPYLGDAGFSLQAASFVLVLQRVCGAGSKLMWGMLAERVPVRFCLAGNYLFRAVGLVMLVAGPGSARVYISAVVTGLLSNAFGPLQAQVWADYYGRRSVGAIRGVIAPATVAASIAGPLLAAGVYDRFGSYDGGFWFFAALLGVSAVVVGFARPPGAPPQR